MNDRARFNQFETNNIWIVEQPPPFPDWMEEHFVLTEESSATGSAGPWKNRPSQRGLGHAMANLNIQTYIERAPAQVGKSKRLAGLYGYNVRELRRNVIIYQPTDPLAKTFSVTQIDGMLMSSPRVAEALLCDPAERHKYNSNKFKVFSGATAYVRGCSDNNLRQITGDLAVVDDWDGCPRVVRGAGNKNMGTVRSRAGGRTSASVQPCLRLVSTPGEKGDSLVQEGVDASPHVMIRETPCPHCGTHQELILNTTKQESSHGLIYDQMGSDQESALTARYKCIDCSKEFSWGQMRHQEKQGRWRCIKTGIIQFELPGDPRDGHYYDPTVCTETMIDDPVEIAYTHSALISDDKPWSKILAEYFSALRLLAAGDSSALVQFFNEVLGIVYEPPDAEVFTNDELCKRLETYDAECPYGVQMVALIVDVQKRYFDYEYVGVGYALETWGMGTGEIYGQPFDRSHKCWDELAELEKRVFVDQRGNPVPVSVTFIDAQNRPDDVLTWCEKRPRFRMGIRGQSRIDHPICMLKAPVATKQPGTYRCYQIKMGAQMCSEKLYAMLGIEKPDEWKPGDSVPGLMHFPNEHGYREIDKDTGEITSKYFDQLIAEQLVEVVHGGKVVHVYDCPKGVRNEKHDIRKIVLAGVEARIRTGFRFRKPDQLPPYVEPTGDGPDNPPPSTQSKANSFASLAKGFVK
jgi:phage terminase large subunit GpA-like protein